MKKTIIFSIIVLLLAGAISSASGKDKAPVSNKIDNILKWEEQFGFNGSVLVVKDGKTILNKGYGFADKRYHFENSPKTAFFIASVSKPITALAVMKLVEEKKIALNDQLTRYFPNVPDNKKDITIEMLLTHTSGMQQTYSCDKVTDRTIAIETILSKTPMVGKPGEKYVYSGDGYTLLAALIELVSGRNFERYVTENILTPAGVKKPAFAGQTLLLEHDLLAAPWALSKHKTLRDVQASWGKKGRSGMILSVEDIYKIDEALEGRKIFKTNIVDDILSPKLPNTANNYGYGFNIFNTAQGTKVYGHGGDDDELGHNFVYLSFPEEKVKIFIASNSGLYINSSWSNVVGSLIQKLLFPSNYDYPSDKLYHTEFTHPSFDKLEKFEGVYQSAGNINYQLSLNDEQQLVLCPVGMDAANAFGYPKAYHVKNELARSILETSYNKQYELLQQNSADNEAFERLKKMISGLWESLEKANGKFERIEIMGTANTHSGNATADIATWCKLVFKNRSRVYRMEWDANNKIAGLGGGSIPFPMMYKLNAIAKSEFIGFDPANAKTIAVNFLSLENESKPVLELNIDGKTQRLYNTGDMSLLPKRSAAVLLYNVMKTKGIAATRAEVENIKAGKLNRFNVDEGELNDYGYALLREKKFEEAIALFTITVENFPSSANAFDSLGEAYLKAGNKTEALKNYKKVLELNPKSQNAKDIIQKLSEGTGN